MTPFVTAGAGFLLAVLWFDLMHDVQVLRHQHEDAPEDVLASIAGYYRRVTTDARPMNRLVSAVMLVTIVSVIIQITRDEPPNWVGWVSLVLVVVPVALAVVHTFRAAVRLGRRRDSIGVQSALARSILRDHLLCLAAIVALLTVQLGFGRGDDSSSSSTATTSPFVVEVSADAITAADEVGVDLVDVTNDSLVRVASLLPGLGKVITIKIDPVCVVPEVGIGGVTDPDGGVSVCLNSPNQIREEQLRVWLPDTLAHEAHHSVRILRGPGTGTTLGEKIVSEGLATVFVREAFPDTPVQPWAQALDQLQARELWALAQSMLDEALIHTEYSRGEWFFGAGRLPRWAGYTLGVGVVTAYLANHPGTTAASLVRESAPAIIAASGYKP